MSILFFLIILWILLHLKTTRADGLLIKKIHPYRRLMAYIMPSKTESIVYFDEDIKADKLIDFVNANQDKFNMTHCVVAATGLTMLKNPKMNRFIAGRRLYQRQNTSITFSMKRKKLHKSAKLSAVKLNIDPKMNFSGLCDKINQKINKERSGKKTYSDKELNLLNFLPRPLLVLFVNFAKILDYYNLLPKSFIDNDAMYCSMFVANLGSLGMNAGYHHLFEWGTCPHFVMVGKVCDKAIIENGNISVRKMIRLRFTYDERIEDGLNAKEGIEFIKKILENPQVFLSNENDEKKELTFNDIVNKF